MNMPRTNTPSSANRLAPDKKISLASHGEGELGDGDFHIWLMSEPEHRKVTALADINADNNLDTAPDAYHAFWSEDARYVAIALPDLPSRRSSCPTLPYWGFLAVSAG